MQDLSSISSSLHNEFAKSNNTRKRRILDFIDYMTFKILYDCILLDTKKKSYDFVYMYATMLSTQLINVTQYDNTSGSSI